MASGGRKTGFVLQPLGRDGAEAAVQADHVVMRLLAVPDAPRPQMAGCPCHTPDKDARRRVDGSSVLINWSAKSAMRCLIECDLRS